MAADMDSETEISNASSVNIDVYRRLVQNYLKLNLYSAALFWADKVVALSCNNPRDVYWLAQCMFLLKQYHRAVHLLRRHNLEKTNIMCNYLTVLCLKEANDLNEAIKVIGLMDNAFSHSSSVIVGDIFDDVPKHQIRSALLLLKGKILEDMDNRKLATDCFKEALKHDVYCYEAFDALVKHQMLSAQEEEEVIKSLPIKEQCPEPEAEILLALYDCKRKKYHAPVIQKFCAIPVLSPFQKDNVISTPGLITTPISVSTPNVVKFVNKNPRSVQTKEPTTTELSDIGYLRNSLDLAVAEAERLYYNCSYQDSVMLTESVLQCDPYHQDCLPIHVACQVELKQSNKLFSLAHNLVDLYPDLAVSWFAVGCYYYVIGKSDSARRFLAKATSLDRLFGPAWLAYGHSFAIESEHDQAMAAYFKASQLMQGCHLPLLYIGLECGLTNNVRLAMKFFQQAQSIAPDDPFVMHEMGVIAYQSLDYKGAEKYFKAALEQVKRVKKTLSPLPQRWQPLLNNLGHVCRKLKKYDEALKYHKQALILSPQCAGSYSAIAYIYTLMGKNEQAVDWFHKALGLKRDDTFSTTMLNYVIVHFANEQPAYPNAPDHIPDFLVSEQVSLQETNDESANQMESELPDMSMSM